MNERIATCSCGQLSIRVTGEPSVVAACNCLECQKRTGSIFGVAAFFDDERVIEKSGVSSCFERSSDAGRRIWMYFCPSCGSSVFWKGEFLEGRTGIAVGCFADPSFPKPRAVAWTATQHGWIEFPEDCLYSSSQDFKNA